MNDAQPASSPSVPEPLRLREALRVEVLDDEVLALDPLEGVVHRLEGTAARIVTAVREGREPDLSEDHAAEVVAALTEARILEP